MLKNNSTSRIILLRHAKTEAGKGKAIGHTHVPLSDTGKAQAENFSILLQDVIDKNKKNQTSISLYSSPSQRALESYGLIHAQSSKHITIIQEYQEIFLGDWEGVPFDTIKRKWPELYAERGLKMTHFRPPFGDSYAENFQDVQDRMLQGLRTLAKNISLHDRKQTAIIISHAGCIRALLCHFLGIPLENIMQIKVDNLHGMVLSCHDGALQLEESYIDCMDIARYFGS